MRSFVLIVVVSALSVVSLLAGGVLGGIVAGYGGQFVGMAVGGLIGIWGALTLLVRRRWLTAAERRSATIGASIGFTIALVFTSGLYQIGV